MKLEGDYLYPETPEEAIAFIDCEVEVDLFLSGWSGAEAGFRIDFRRLDRPEQYRIHRTVALESLRYRKGEPWCFAMTSGILVGNWEERCVVELRFHKRAIYLVSNADEFRDLAQWLEEK